MAIRGLGFVDPENRVGEATAYTQQVWGRFWQHLSPGPVVTYPSVYREICSCRHYPVLHEPNADRTILSEHDVTQVRGTFGNTNQCFLTPLPEPQSSPGYSEVKKLITVHSGSSGKPAQLCQCGGGQEMGLLRGSRPFTRGWNSTCTWKLTAIDCIYFLQSVLATSIARWALPMGKWEHHMPVALPRDLRWTDAHSCRASMVFMDFVKSGACGQDNWDGCESRHPISLVACPLSVAGVFSSP